MEDAAATAERLVAAGGELAGPAVRTPWGSVNARLNGPDGQQVTLYSTAIHVGQRPRLDGSVLLVEDDPAWATTAAQLIRDIRNAAPDPAFVLAHVGSTAVPGLAAKPVIDLVMGVRDPVDEPAYVPALEQLGYRLHAREPEWHEHRLLKRSDPTGHLHVFAAGADEIDRMLAFRDHLRADATDRNLYLRTKHELAARTWAFVQDYADAKSDVVATILSRALREPRPRAGQFVIVTGAASSHRAGTADDVARRLALPLLASDTVATVLRGSECAIPLDPEGVTPLSDTILLAVARRTRGAVLDALWEPAATADLETLPGQVIEVGCDPASKPARAVKWPVLEQHRADPGDVERLARHIRQLGAAP